MEALLNYRNPRKLVPYQVNTGIDDPRLIAAWVGSWFPATSLPNGDALSLV
jgi:hypothetical protein